MGYDTKRSVESVMGMFVSVDEPECRYDLRKALMYRIYGKTSYQRLEVCNQCYSKLKERLQYDR